MFGTFLSFLIQSKNPTALFETSKAFLSYKSPKAVDSLPELKNAVTLASRPSGVPQLRRDPVVFALETTSNDPLKSIPGWVPANPDSKGTYSGKAFEGGWIAFTVNVPVATKLLLNAQGDSYAIVNGEPLVGDVYESGYARLPVQLNQGDNQLLFYCVRGEFKAHFEPFVKPIELDSADSTLPDIRPDASGNLLGAMLIRNSSDDIQTGLTIRTEPGGATEKVQDLQPMSLGKVGFSMRIGKETDYTVELMKGKTVLDSQKITLRRRETGQTYKETFKSGIDGSVQYFAVNPAWKTSQPNLGLALSLHGAGVEAIGQADAYSSKPDINIVCPTNRRPFGFDWEDWGRLDALEVLDIATKELAPDLSRIYLVGHSMGGHGTILNGALYPGMFAAIAPSAGWISAATYAGFHPLENPVGTDEILQRAMLMDETRQYLPNYKAEGIYLIQGGADDNVPPTEERNLTKLLSSFHKDYVYHEEPGQNHWWDLSPEPGADCVDLSEMFDFLSKHALPPNESVHNIDFSTTNPEVSSSCYWATIQQQIIPEKLSRVELHVDPFLRKITGTTTNVERVSFNTSPLAPIPPKVNDAKVEIDLDGQSISLTLQKADEVLYLKKINDVWTFAGIPNKEEKSPDRSGPLRLAFQNDFVAVYPTHGTAEENKWALVKARYDAELWWYRGNGEYTILPDTSFDPKKFPDRSVILYGNSTTNSAWKTLIPHCPIVVKEGSATDAPESDVFCYPRSDSNIASVIVFGGNNLIGMKETNLLNYMQPMTAYPDYLRFSPEALDPQSKGGILDAGYFTNEWQIFPK